MNLNPWELDGYTQAELELLLAYADAKRRKLSG